MAFLEKSELKTRSHIEVINAITRDDDSIVEIIISESISFMKGYLTARYDADAIFNQTGGSRDQVVLKMLKAIVVYEIYSAHNPLMMTDVVKDNQAQAIAWLKAVQKGQINPDLPTVMVGGENPKSPMLYGGNPKRGNHY